MKIIYRITLIALVSTALFSCSKSAVTPARPKIDTSKTLINDTRLVGNWAIVTDTIAYLGDSVMYHGSSYDYFKFTQYGNLYIAESYGKFIDTAIYNITSVSNQVGWNNLYTSINGASTNQVTTTPAYTIVKLDAENLVLMQNTQVAGQLRYEQLTFKKSK